MRRSYLPDGKSILERVWERNFPRTRREKDKDKFFDKLIMVLPEFALVAFFVAAMLNALLSSKLFDN